jgi:hypothetical protein
MPTRGNVKRSIASGPEEDPTPDALERDERDRRNEDPEEDRDAAEARHGPHVQPAPLSGIVDDAEDPPHVRDRRREHEHDREREQEAPDELGVVQQPVEHGVRLSPSAARSRAAVDGLDVVVVGVE